MRDMQVHAFMLRICVVGAVNSSHNIRNPINIGRWLLLGASPSSSDAAPIQKTPNRDSSTPNVPHIANVVDVYKDLTVKSAVSFVQ